MTAEVNPLDLTGKHILVTGASAGIGRATCVLLASLGARLMIHGRNEAELNRTLTMLAGDNHSMSLMDMSQTDELAPWVQQLAAEHGHFDGFVHCAGVQITKSIRSFDAEFFDQTMRTNLASALAISRGFRYRRPKAQQGSIVLVSSIAGLIGQPGNIVYGASKAGLMSATRGLAMELLRDNIRVNCVAPAMVETEMAQRTRDDMTQAQFAHIEAQHPMGLGKPEDVANAIAFLLSDAAKWINAVTLPVEGAYLAN
ncbi:SDR family oxidoreductase [Shewanella corallii]|uniref:SDR family oxidoreductase n=1 Tax=Shewanella corallii TaxID=560080 RepID=A0ABT0N5H0_9GAMM|nr:SDR family oxidoreductase [Shewanella corallii]MCL2913057.1 SDR family oxidoreductase [Shewanella corallii]